MKITIVGCGNMGAGMAQRLSTSNQLFLYNQNPQKAKDLELLGYGKAVDNLETAIKNSEIIILAVKPQNLKEAAASMAKHLNKSQTLISILAGTPIATLKHLFPTATVIRMMPNLALIYGQGVIALASESNLPGKEKDSLTSIFECLGKITWLPESKIDALSSLAGSGPAFFFIIIEAMIDAGVAMGFTAKDAQGLVQQMLQGSLTLLDKTGKHPGELKWQVTSPGGTTIAGIKKLEENALRSAIIETFLATYERAKELSRHP